MNAIQKRLALLRFLFHKHFMPSQKLTRRTSFGQLGVSFDWMGQNIYLDNFDNTEQRIYQLLLVKTDQVLDVGANLGFYSLLFASLVPEGMVFSFEPSTRDRSLLESNIKLNFKTNITVLPFGLGSESRTRTLLIDEKNHGMNRIVTETEGGARTESIAIRKLDDFVCDNELRDLDFIKIDVEGYESEVLKGGTDSIRRFKPNISFESWPTLNKNFRNDMSVEIELLSYLGYQFYQPSGSGLRQLSAGDLVTSLNLFAIGTERADRLRNLVVQ